GTMNSFSKKTYSELLQLIQEHQYNVISYDHIKATHKKKLLLRHDIDFSLDYAHMMAAIEAENNIQATYFIMLRSPVYNALSRHSATLLREIVKMGHLIGLHFDAGYSQGEERNLSEWIA